MADFQLQWNPATSGLNQIPKRITRYNYDLGLDWQNGPTLANNVITYLFQNQPTNVVQKFKITNICTNGATDGNIIEMIKFACTEISLVSKTSTSLNIQTVLTGNSDIDGGPISVSGNTDISVVAALYDTVGNFVQNGVTTGNDGTYHSNTSFSSLSPSTTYIVKVILQATINNVLVSSNDANQLNSFCTAQFTTDPQAACPPPTGVTATCENCYIP